MSARPLLSRTLKHTDGSLRSSSTPRSPWICQSCQLAQSRRLPTSSRRQPDLGRSLLPKAPRHVSAFAVKSNAKAFSAAFRQQHTQSSSKELDTARKEGLASKAPDRVEEVGEKLQRFISVTRHSWNELVGYTEIEKYRAQVAEQEELIQTRKQDLQLARDVYRTAVDKHASSLRETRDLLTRKDDWSEQDAARFASLHTSTRADESAEHTARRALQTAELALERETERLSSRIGAVYQAESMYNAKILQVKTWWTWALMAFNITVFLFNVYLIQIGLNPRYRTDIDLSDKAVAKIRAALLDPPPSADAGPELAESAATPRTVLLKQRGSGGDGGEISLAVVGSDNAEMIKAKLQAEAGFPVDVVRLFVGDTEVQGATKLDDLGPFDPSTTAVSFAIEPESIQPAADHAIEGSSVLRVRAVEVQDHVKSLFSSSKVTWQMHEITALALQSAATGAVAAALVAVALQRR